MPTIFTIGYQQATQPALIAALKEAGVEILADVRAAIVAQAGVLNERAQGPRRKPRNESARDEPIMPANPQRAA